MAVSLHFCTVPSVHNPARNYARMLRSAGFGEVIDLIVRHDDDDGWKLLHLFAGFAVRFAPIICESLLCRLDRQRYQCESDQTRQKASITH